MKNRSSNFLLIGIAIIIAIILLLTYCHKKSQAPTVYFGNLKDGAQVESPFKVEMKAENLVVEPATKGVNAGHGHFHIIIDSPLPTAGAPVPMDSLHIHYGMGQTNAMLDLPEGEHVLTLQFADGAHMPYDPQVTQTVHILVTKRNLPPVDSAKQMRETGKASSTGPDSLPNTPPPINPGYGGGAGMGTTGGGMGGAGSSP